MSPPTGSVASPEGSDVSSADRHNLFGPVTALGHRQWARVKEVPS
jgi:hypothetical protein